ncbi:hypothetical protein NECAME_12821 [Necator americanus]|uniref:Uncharacterized protein n=1 Tax=Necator americanus TaxID=51031 RepID=W2SYF3_NECAM|nr:hypothetical protein NECAME_12821 [Necator americanus]ETN74665.1 hypothetical protein NECAME_12821 [Necator americanus]
MHNLRRDHSFRISIKVPGNIRGHVVAIMQFEYDAYHNYRTYATIGRSGIPSKRKESSAGLYKAMFADPFEFDLYDEPASVSDEAFNRMATLCARLQKRAPYASRDRKAAPLVFRLCDMLN